MMIDPLPEPAPIDNQYQQQNNESGISYPIHRFVIMQGHKFQNYPSELSKLPQTYKNNNNYGFGMT